MREIIKQWSYVTTSNREDFCTSYFLRAADGFSKNNLVGTGIFGCVSRTGLRFVMQFAVKVSHRQCKRTLKSSETECEVMRNIRDWNLVKIVTSCSSHNFKAFALEYMPNGSLEDRLYSCTCILDILQRLSKMIDVTSAFEYLHFG